MKTEVFAYSLISESILSESLPLNPSDFFPKQIDLWRKAASTFDTFKYIAFTDDQETSVELSSKMNLAPIVSAIENELEYSKTLEIYETEKRDKHQFQLLVPKTIAPHEALHIARTFYCDLFHILNLSLPGSCNFHPAILSGPAWKGHSEEKIGLSNTKYDHLLHTAKKTGISIEYLELDKVWNWYKNVRTSSTSKPKNRTEHALFALWQLSQTDISELNIVLVFSALEALFGFKSKGAMPQRSFSILLEQMRLFLNISEADFAKVKGDFTSLNELRNRTVHGGLELWHPFGMHSREPLVDRQISQLIETTDFGFFIIVATLQKCIKREIQYPEFNFEITPKNF